MFFGSINISSDKHLIIETWQSYQTEQLPVAILDKTDIFGCIVGMFHW